MKSFSIVIPTIKKNLPYLKICVDSIQKNSKYPHEIIVVTNGEPFDLEGMTGVTQYHQDEPGQCRATNKGFQLASSKAVCAMDDDMYVTPDWDYWLERYYDLLQYPVVCSVRYEYDCIDPFVRPPRELVGDSPETFNGAEFEKFWDAQQDFKLEEGFNIPWLWDRNVWDAFGGYDEAYDPFASNSDSDFLYRVKVSGLKPLLVRRSAVFHFVGTSGWGTHAEYYNKNRQTFIDKFGFDRGDGASQWHGTRLIEIPLENLKFYPDYYERFGKL